jgi:Ca-activated chloride channel family protein
MVEIRAHIDYYALMGVSDNVMPDDLRHAYRELARMYHPDAPSGDADKFRQIQEAYDVLNDPVYRRTYDRLRESRGYVSSAVSPITFDIFQNRNQLPILDSEQIFYVILDIQPETQYVYNRQPLNITLVIDCSNSMRGSRIHNVKMAGTDLLNALREDDYLSVITFNDRARIEAPASQVGNKRIFQSAIASIATGGGTEIFQGLLTGLTENARFATEDTINHILLLTDGITYGDEDLALTEAKKALNQGIGISTFGIGEDWNDVFLDKLAQEGGGVSQYIESPMDVRTFLKERIQDLSHLIARRLQISLITAPYVHIQSVYRALPHMESLPISADNTVYVGDIPAGEPMVFVFTVVIENSIEEMGNRRLLRLEMQAEKPDIANAFSVSRDIHVTFTEQPVEERIPSRIFSILSKLSVYQLQEKAWYALEDGETRLASRYLESAATQLFDLGYPELAQAAMLEVNRISSGDSMSLKGRKQIRYGTRSLAVPPNSLGGENGSKGQ